MAFLKGGVMKCKQIRQTSRAHFHGNRRSLFTRALVCGIVKDTEMVSGTPLLYIMEPRAPPAHTVPVNQRKSCSVPPRPNRRRGVSSLKGAVLDVIALAGVGAPCPC